MRLFFDSTALDLTGSISAQALIVLLMIFSAIIISFVLSISAMILIKKFHPDVNVKPVFAILSFALSALFFFIGNVFGSIYIVVGVCLALVGIALIIANKRSASHKSPTTPSISDRLKSPKKNICKLPEFYNNSALVDSYPAHFSSLVVSSYLANKMYSQITLVQEPENALDPEAVALYLGTVKIGYITSNFLKTKIHESINNNWCIFAHLGNAAAESDSYNYWIGFYKPFSCFRCKETTIAQPNGPGLIQAGAFLKINYSYERGAYIVFSDQHEAGELPNSFTPESGKRSKHLVGIFNEYVDSNDGDKNAKITVYYVE